MPDGAFLRIGDGERKPLVHGDAGTIRIPGRDGDLVALEQRDQLVGLGVEHRRALRDRLDRLDAGIDILQRAALELVQGQEEVQPGGAADVADRVFAGIGRVAEIEPGGRWRLDQLRVVDERGRAHHGDDIAVILAPGGRNDVAGVLQLLPVDPSR